MLDVNSRDCSIVKNPHTDKLFLSTPKGNFKVEQGLDLKKKVCFLYEENDFENGCLINERADNTIASLDDLF